jgi:hypothetical protein
MFKRYDKNYKNKPVKIKQQCLKDVIKKYKNNSAKFKQ